MIKINNRELKKHVGTLKHWCDLVGVKYSTLTGRANRGTNDKVLSEIIKSGADLNKVLEVDDVECSVHEQDLPKV